jgi:hypothetical protein
MSTEVLVPPTNCSTWTLFPLLGFHLQMLIEIYFGSGFAKHHSCTHIPNKCCSCGLSKKVDRFACDAHGLVPETLVPKVSKTKNCELEMFRRQSEGNVQGVFSDFQALPGNDSVSSTCVDICKRYQSNLGTTLTARIIE